MGLKDTPVRFFTVFFLLGAAALYYYLARELDLSPLLAWLAAVNALALPLWAFDKLQARRAGWRVPELSLHLIAALGATPASFCSMLLFSHKKRKPIFWVLYSLLLVVQIIAYNWWQGRGGS